MKKLLICGLLGLTAAAANADVKYTTEISMMQGGKATPFSSTTTWVKNGMQRVDSLQSIGAFRHSESTVTNCNTRQQLRFDSSLKIYTTEAVGASRPSQPNVPGSHNHKDTGKSGTGKIIMTPTVKFLGKAKLDGRDTRHYRITQRIQSSGCAGNTDMTLRVEIWVADVKLPNVACASLAGDWKQAYNMPGNRCKLTFEQRGDKNAYLAAYKGLPVKTVTYDNSGKAMMQMRITNISNANLNSSVFQAPGNFKKLGNSEYDKARQDAMITAMTGGRIG